ncbi:glycosyltransferase family 2 protein [Candidatus Woesearchaeota archaeon]|nr:glycosyltransferase family 2 protein [Candidatus Woesearchaeota archaeon]
MDILKIIIWISYFITLYFLVYWFIFFIEKKDQIHKELNKKVKLKKFPFVSVIIPCYNEEQTIIKTLESAVNLDYPKNKLEFVVIDDGSTDNTARKVKNFIKTKKIIDIKYIYQKNKGKAAALNTALKSIKGTLFACLDADSFVDKNALVYMVKEHSQKKSLAITTPVMKIFNPKHVLEKFQRLEYMAGMLLIKLMSYVDSNYIAPGPFSVYKTEIIKKLGGFDESNLVEDQEIAYRVQEKHYKIKQCSNAFVTTVAPKNFAALNRQRNRWFKGSILNLIKYRKLILNREYGDFGFFQMPINIISFVLAIVAVFSFLYYTVKPLLSWMKDLYLIRFDILPFLFNLDFNFDIRGINLPLILLIGISLVISLLMLYHASRASQDRVRKYGVIYIVPYFFIYFIFLGFVIIKVFFELLIGIRQKW